VTDQSSPAPSASGNVKPWPGQAVEQTPQTPRCMRCGRPASEQRGGVGVAEWWGTTWMEMPA
jgi:hypothetical protein